MLVEPTGVITTGVCEIQSERCVAKTAAPITVVWTAPARKQVNVCAPCLEEMVANGEWEVAHSRIRHRYDVAVVDKTGRLIVAAEVKGSPQAQRPVNIEQAVRIYRNLVSHSALAAAPYFVLVVFPSDFFIWARGASIGHAASPTFKVHDYATLKPFTNSDADVADPGAQEEIVAQWLEHLSATPPEQTSPKSWVSKSGLHAAVHGGKVVRQAAALPG